jgi:hypothetical protein
MAARLAPNDEANMGRRGIPQGHRRAGSDFTSSRHFGGIGLHLMATISTPDEQANMGSRRVPERHRRAGFRFHLTRRLLARVACGGA